MYLSREDFQSIRDLVNRKTGLFFDEKKTYFVTNRLSRRMEEIGCDNVKDYIRTLNYDLEEFSNFVDSLTINETYFFRDYPQLRMFAEEILPLVCEEKRKKHNKSLRIWSAGCSSGEEPYTIVIILLEMIEDLYSWRVEILGTDINRRALKMCREATYTERSLKDVPLEYREKYFIPYQEQYQDKYKVKDEIKKYVRFEYLNLNDGLRLQRIKNVDFIFCRNVLIYFDPNSCKEIVSSFYNSLNKGGYIFLGSSESMSRISAAFKLVRFNNGLAYMKE